MRRLFLIQACLLACFLAQACRSPFAGGPGVALVGASRSAHDLMAARWKGYVATDPTLDLLTRDQLSKVVDDWDLAIQAAEEAIRPDAPPPPVPAGVPR